MILRQRDPRVECPAFLAFVRRRPCCACGAPPPSQAAHVRFSDAAAGRLNPGIGAKSHDRRAVPLCSDCHLDGRDAQHRVGDERKFWARVGKNPDEIADRLWGQFVRRCARSPEQRKAVLGRAKRVLKKRKPMMEPGVEADLIVMTTTPIDFRKPSRAKDPELYRYQWGQGRPRVTRIKRGGHSGLKTKASANRWPPKGSRKLRSGRR